jgi:MFS family permease
VASVGRRATILLAIGLFALGSVLCAIAHNTATLLAGRCIQGTGAGGVIVLTYVLLSDLYTLEQRSKMLSVIGLMWMCGTCLGPIIGGGFTQAASWVCGSQLLKFC